MAPFYPGAPPTRILSWSQMVREADPDYTRLSRQPWVYDFSNGRLFIDAMNLYDFDFIAAGLVNNGGILALSDATGWPTNSGVPGGELWSNGGEPTIAASVVPGPASALVFGLISSASLLATGGRGLPFSPPPVGSGILWNPGGIAGGQIFVA